MRMPAGGVRTWVLLTGATGFIGPSLAYELISRGHRVLCLVRAGSPAQARERIVRALRGWAPDVERLFETGRLAAVRGDLHTASAGVSADVRAALRGRVASAVHAAGNVRFAATHAGEPARTNVGGTERLFELAADLGCRDWHFISTAYVAGAVEEAYEQLKAGPPAFHNAYERSKWEAEQLAAALAGGTGAALTIYRPSVVVGHSVTGRTAYFRGIYYLFRATSLLAQAVARQAGVDRRAVPLRIPARAEGRPNLICCDDLARSFGILFDAADARGGVYHLTHPQPPTNAQLKRVLEAEYDLAGGRFLDEGDPSNERREAPGRDSLQRLFDDVTQPVADYLFDAPRFDRSNSDRFIPRPPAAWTDDRIARLIRFAEHGGWRPAGAVRRAETQVEDIASYFHDFLPAQLANAPLSAIREAELAVRFEIGAATGGRWWCRFSGGRLAAVEPADRQLADIVYRTSAPLFRAAVRGEISGAELFLSGEAQVEGDIERALKFAALLEAFVRAHPYQEKAAAPARQPSAT